MNKYKREIVSAMKSGKTVRRHHREAYRSRAFEYRWWYDFETYGRFSDAQAEYDKETREVFADGYWIMRAPNWWAKLVVTVPERAQARLLCHKLLSLLDLEDAPVFPDGRRTQIGYW